MIILIMITLTMLTIRQAGDQQKKGPADRQAGRKPGRVAGIGAGGQPGRQAGNPNPRCVQS